MSDQNDIEDELLRKDESDCEMARASGVVLERPSPTMTRQDFDLMREQNERILKELTRLKRKRSRSRSKSHKRSKSRDVVSDSGRSQLSDRHAEQNGRNRAKRRREDSMSDSDCSQQSLDNRSKQNDDASDTEEQPADLIKSLIQKSKKTRSSSTEKSDRPKIETSAAHVLDRMQKELETNAEEGPEIDENFIKILDKIYENINQRKDNSKE